MQFSEFNLAPNLIKGIEEAGYAECTLVQQETLQHTLVGRDVFVQSQTGTGKTAAFLISIFELMKRNTDERERAIIITPTRELAVQIAEETKLLSLYMDLNIVTIYGGVGYAPQIKAIAEGIDILIGTPGRIIDMSNKRMLNLRQFSIAVIDEADRMFDMGFVNDVQTILHRLPQREARQTMLFSATLSAAVKQLASGSMNEPAEVHIAPENITVDTIEQQVYHVGSSRKTDLLIGLLKKYSASRVLIFVNMKHIAEELAQRLTGNGFDADYLTGDLPQKQRLNRIDKFKNNELPVLIATDVAARGIHVDDLELVINYDIPMHSENYVHRIGRTARAGKSGRAITLACETFVEFLAPVEKFINMKIPSVVAEDDLYFPDVTAGKSFRTPRRKNDSDSRFGSNRNRPGNRGPSSGRGSQNRTTSSRSYSGRSEKSSGYTKDTKGNHRSGYRGTKNELSREEYPQELAPKKHPSIQKPARNDSTSRVQGDRSSSRQEMRQKGVSGNHRRTALVTQPPAFEAAKKKKNLFSKVLSLFR